MQDLSRDYPDMAESIPRKLSAEQKLKRLRVALFAAALFMGAQSAWVIAPEVIRPDAPAFPRDLQSSLTSKSDRDRAVRAAEVGIIRGDLWAEAAIDQSPELVRDITSKKTVPEAQLARATAEKAASLAPHDSRIWLFLASLDCLAHRNVSSTLKMSYFTGPSEIELMPLRLLVATCSAAIDDLELQTNARRSPPIQESSDFCRLSICLSHWKDVH